MLGSMASLLGYWLVFGAMWIWMLIKIYRNSPGLALATFFFWPAALVALIRNWGDRESDIRIPFFAAAIAAGMMLFMAMRTQDKAISEAALLFSDAEIAEIRAEDPELAAKLESARAEAIARGEVPEDWAEDYSEDDYSEGDYVEDDEELMVDPDTDDTAADSDTAVALPPPARFPSMLPPRWDWTPAEDIDPRDLRPSLRGLSWRLGQVGLPEARATLNLPSGFRYVPKLYLQRFAQLRRIVLDPDTQGWVIHERVDLGAPGAWWIEVRFANTGYLPLPPPPAATEAAPAPDAADQFALDVDRAATSRATRLQFASAALAPQWDGSRGIATWAAVAADRRADLHAARPLRHGVLLFSVRALAEPDWELGLRASRLIAAHAEIDPSSRYPLTLLAGLPPPKMSLTEWIAGWEPAESL